VKLSDLLPSVSRKLTVLDESVITANNVVDGYLYEEVLIIRVLFFYLVWTVRSSLLYLTTSDKYITHEISLIVINTGSN